MRLLKAQNTNTRNIRGRGVVYDVNNQVDMSRASSLIIPKTNTANRSKHSIEGQMIYNTDIAKFEVFEGGQWQSNTDIADNVYYVSKNGSDNNNGKTIGSAFASLDYAVTQIPEGSTIKVKSGDYTLNNPIRVPRDVAIVGDSLRTVTVRAGNPTQDMFWVSNGSYLEQMTFKDHESPAAAVAFAPDGSAGEIFQSPYVQNCTSITTTGTGMRVDGNHAQGLKSMVVDAFTQYNQGGIGIHMLNLGNTQLVSVFTICCDVAILCENGGFCSLTNSNSSFGNLGLKADGVSLPKYYGSVAQTIANPTFGETSVLINNLNRRPNSGDAVLFNTTTEDPIYYTISTASPLKIGKTRVDEPVIANQDLELISDRETVLSNVDQIKFDTINEVNLEYPNFDYDQSKCARDIGLIIQAAVDDMIFDTNYKSVVAGRSYYQNSATLTVTTQKDETLFAINYAKTQVLALLTPGSISATRVAENFDNVMDIITNNDADTYDFRFTLPEYDTLSEKSSREKAYNILQDNRQFIEEEAIAYITVNYPDLSYDETVCRRDINYIIDAVIYDVVYKGNSQSLYAGQQYYIGSALQLADDEKTATLDTYKYVKLITGNCLLNISIVALQSSVSQSITGPTTVAISNEVRSYIDIISAYIEDGNYINDFVELEQADYTVQDGDVRAIRDTILSFKSKLQVNTIDFLNNKYSEFSYNKEKCSRDVGLILDAVAMDMALGTNYNSIIAGKSYQRANASLVKADQRIQTKAAIEFVATQVSELNISVTAKSRAALLFAEIIDIFENNTPDTINLVEPSNATTENINAKDLLQSNKEFIIAETIAYINETFNNFSYDEAKCSRDVGLIIEAIALDNVLQTNYNSITAGIAYRRANASTVLTDQLNQTIAAISYIKNVIGTYDFVDQTQANLIVLIDEIINIIKTGSLSTIVYETPLNATQDQIEAVELLNTNKTNIQTQLVDWINLQISTGTPPFVGFVYDEAACRRDVGYIVNALAHDVLYGGNSASRIAAESYFVGTSSQVPGEENQTIAAYEQLKAILSSVIAGYTTEIARVQTLIDITIDVISAGSLTNLPAKQLPNITWTAPTTQAEYATLIDGISFIQTEVINYINTELADFSYDETKCARDVSYIIDALSYDQIYGGNSASRTVALSYFVGAVNQLGADEIQETVGAYEHLSNIIEDIVQGISITPTTGNIETQTNNGGNVATDSEALKLSQNLGYIIEVLKDGNSNSIVREVLPNISWIDTELQSSYLEIKTNKSRIQSNSIDFIDTRFGRFNYDQSKCSRDVGLILEAVTSDLVLGTNYRSVLAGSSYYRASASKVINDQLRETVAALEFLKNNTLELITTDSTTQEPEYNQLINNFDTVIEIIENGESAIPSIVYTSPNTIDTNRESARDILQANRQFLIDEGVAYISAVYPVLGYDRDVCERDVGLIIDAISYDMIFDSNFRSITAGRAYYREGAAVVTAEQKEATLGAFAYLKTLTSELVSDNATAVSRVESSMDVIIDILDNGLGSVPSYNLPLPTGGTANASDVGFLNARNNVDLNRGFIAAEVVQFITDQYPGLIYNQIDCERDIDYILDAVSYDLTYGGNLETLVAARAYYSNSVLQLGTGEKTATIAAYSFMRDLLNEIALNNDVTELQSAVLQVNGTAGSIQAADTTKSLIDVIIDLITDDSIVPSIINPDSSWVTAGLITEFSNLQTNKSTVQTQVTAYIEENYAYKEDKCREDIGYIVDAVTYDVVYNGNGQTVNAAGEYYSGGILRIPANERIPTINTYKRLKDVATDCVTNTQVNALQTVTTQNTSLTAASSTESTLVSDLFDIVIRVLEKGYVSEVTFDETVNQEVISGTEISFHQYSLITASGHTFEWVGAGTNVNSALPYEGGRPIVEQQVTELNGGRVYYTGTDQEGDFRIGNELTINRTNGTIEGDTFDRSLFAVLTPYILAIED